MYRGFVIKKSTIDDLPSLYTRALVGDAYKEVAASIELDKRKQREGIKQEIMGDEDGFIDADTLMNACMPQVHEYDIFISHSHRDLKYAHRLADYILKRFGLRCFVDSDIWLNSEEDIQKPYDQMNKRGSSIKYDDVLKSSAHVHAMLSMSLLKMMDSCVCCIFIDPEEEYIPMDSVSSAWIYEEVTMFNYIDKHLSRNTRVTENFSARPRIIYKCDFSNMQELTLHKMASKEKGLTWLDYLCS